MGCSTGIVAPSSVQAWGFQHDRYHELLDRMEAVRNPSETGPRFVLPDDEPAVAAGVQR